MKRETKGATKQQWPAWRERNGLRRALPEEGPPMPGACAFVAATDLAAVLDALNQADRKDSRQRAEIRDLKKRLETARCRFAAMGIQAFVDECDLKKPLKEKR